MNSPIGLVASALAAVIALAILKRASRRTKSDWPVAARPILTTPESVLFTRLRAALPSHVILSQVALSQILTVRPGKDWQAVFNRISRLVVDFVVCSPDFSPLVVLELDDKTHNAPRRIDADRRLNEALAAAGIPVIRYNVKAMQSEAALRDAVKRAISSEANAVNSETI